MSIILAGETIYFLLYIIILFIQMNIFTFQMFIILAGKIMYFYFTSFWDKFAFL